jgi:pyruvate dehydrogenase E2 component (dihydrolipoamide acetyltransferase)
MIMATKNIALPELGEGVTEGELVKWLVKPGDSIKADQPIAEMMTDKATVEVPSPSAGTVKELKAKDGDVITVGQILIVIDDAGGASAGASSAAAAPAPKAAAPAQAAKPAASANANGSNGAAPKAASGGGGTKEIALPELGEGVTEGELVKWLVKPGDQIKQDQAIAEMMTDKATVEVPSPAAGTVKELRGKEGDVVTVGQVMIVIETAGGAGATAQPAASANGAAKPAAASSAGSAGANRAQPAAMSAATVTHQVPGSAKPASSPGANGGMNIHPPVADAKVLATPATRRLAREMGVDINSLSGSGVAGRVTREDVMKNGAGATAAGAPSYQAPSQTPRPAYQGPAGAAEERVPLRGIRKKIAENLQMAKQIIPHVTLMDEANITKLVELRESLKAAGEKAGVKVTYLPFVMKALIATLREYPAFNATIDDAAGEIVYKKYFNIGFAADTPTGLMVPVIKNADQKSIMQLSKEINELAKKARDGKLALDEMRGATITITNIGSIGATYATPIINHPEVAIIGMYKIQDKPLITTDENGEYQLDLAKVMNYTCTADHRLLDGAMIANFLKAMIARLENPGVLMLDMM